MRRLLPLLLVGAVAYAADLTIGGSNRAEYWLFRDSLDEHFEDKLNLVANYGSLTGKAALFVWDPSRPKNPYHYVNYSIGYEHPALSLTYGHFYQVFGRGLALNSFINEDFRHEMVIRGLLAQTRLFQTELTALSGRPRELFFEENAYVIKNDTTDQLRGADLTTRLIPHFHPGVRYLRINRQQDTTLWKKAFDELYGGGAKAFFGPFDFYGEYIRRWGYEPATERRLEGDGIYASGNISTSFIGVTGEWLDYDTLGSGGFGYRYNEPPTPNRAGVSVNRGIDETGYGVTVVLSPVEKMSLEAARTDVHDTPNRHGVDEWVGKAKIDPSEKSSTEWGFDQSTQRKIDIKVEKKVENKPHFDITYSPDLLHSIEFGAEHNWISADDKDYAEWAAYVGVGRSGLVSLVFRYERRSKTISYLGDEKEWKTLELSWDITETHNLRIKAGNEKGGLNCSGGVCRWERPFDGIKAVLTSQF